MLLKDLLFDAGILWLSIKLVQHLYTYLRPSLLPKYLLQHEDSYALVTGSTDGIGYSLCQELCRYGFNLVLHGRNPEKLARVDKQLRTEFPHLKTRTLILDAGEPLAITRLLDNAVRGLDDIKITVLVNNVGGMGGQTQSVFQSLEDYTSEEVDRVLNTNARFATQLTRALYPNLKRSSPSLIIFLSSIARYGMGYVGVYSATKAYVEALSKALAMEAKAENQNIDTMCAVVGHTKSAGTDYHEKPGFFMPSSEGMAEAILARVGCGCGSTSIIPYWPHWLHSLIFVVFPERLLQNIGIRRLLKLKEEEQRKR